MALQDTSHSLFERLQAVERLPPRGAVDRIEATQQERDAIAAVLGIEALRSLSFDYELRPTTRGRLRLTGRVVGEAIQPCVVTLEPVMQHVSEPVVMELWPAEEIERAKGPGRPTEIEVALEGPEPYSGGAIDVGQIAYEIFASALDPYPRKPGAAFEWSEEPPSAGGAESGPFAALKALKRQ